MSNDRVARWLGPLGLAFLVMIVLGLAVVSPHNQPGQNASGCRCRHVLPRQRHEGLGGLLPRRRRAGSVDVLRSVCLRQVLRGADDEHSWLATAALGAA